VLTALGFEIVKDKNLKLIEKIKVLLIKQIPGGAMKEHFSLSEFFKPLHKDTPKSVAFSPE
jgi:hypothetical protein